MITALTNIQLIADGTIAGGKAILIEGSDIIAIIGADAIPADANIIDLHGQYAAPGFVDLQIYGAGDGLFGNDPSIAALTAMESALLQGGCTGFFATIATNSDEVVLKGIEAAKQYAAHTSGAFLGLHLEGPFINAKRKGAHPKRYIRQATLTELRKWIALGEGIIKMITIAPELQTNEVMAFIAEQNIIVSAGHTDANYEQAIAFFSNGINAATHLYNAMPAMHHREPGIIPAIFEQKPYTSMVADGVHVSYPMIALAKRELGDKLFLITDAVTAGNEGEYQHQLRGDRYVLPDGTLSGSALTMLKAVQNCVEHVGISLPEAVKMASEYPARLAGLEKKGKIEKGYVADLLIFNDSFTPVFTVLQGKIIHNTAGNLTDKL